MTRARKSAGSNTSSGSACQLSSSVRSVSSVWLSLPLDQSCRWSGRGTSFSDLGQVSGLRTPAWAGSYPPAIGTEQVASSQGRNWNRKSTYGVSRSSASSAASSRASTWASQAASSMSMALPEVE